MQRRTSHSEEVPAQHSFIKTGELGCPLTSVCALPCRTLKVPSGSAIKKYEPGWIRTIDTILKRDVLYQAELRAHKIEIDERGKTNLLRWRGFRFLCASTIHRPGR